MVDGVQEVRVQLSHLRAALAEVDGALANERSDHDAARERARRRPTRD